MARTFDQSLQKLYCQLDTLTALCIHRKREVWPTIEHFVRLAMTVGAKRDPIPGVKTHLVEEGFSENVMSGDARF